MKTRLTRYLAAGLVALSCLAMGGCEKGKIGDKKSMITFLGNDYQWGAAQYYTTEGVAADPPGSDNFVEWYNWHYTFMAGSSSYTILIQSAFGGSGQGLNSCPTRTNSPNGTFEITTDLIEFSNDQNFFGRTSPFTVVSGSVGAMTTHRLVSGTVIITQNGDRWTFEVKNGILRPEGSAGADQSTNFTYTGKMTKLALPGY